MSSRRNHSSNNSGYDKYNSRSSNRDKNQRHALKSYESTTTNETRAVQLLRRIFNDDDDTLFSRRIANANQLLKMLEESRGTISDSLEFRQEQKQLLDICVYDEGLQRIILADSATDQFTYKQALEMSPMIVAGIISFLDTMDSEEFLPLAIELLLYFSENYQSVFAQRFNDIIDLLVGWNMDPNLSEAKRAIVISSYSKFSLFWSGYLPFAVDLLHHFLTDMQTLIAGLINATTDEAQAKIWGTCTNVLSCFGAILDTILPLMANSTRNYRDNQMLEMSFSRLVPGILSVATEAQKAGPDDQCNQLISRILLSLISFKPANHRAHQYKLYIYLFAKYLQHEFATSEDCQTYIDLILRFINYWGQNIDQQIVYQLLNTETSPLHRIRMRCADSDQLKSEILLLMRFLIRIPISNNIRNQINNQFIKQLNDFQHQLKQQQNSAVNENDMLQRTVSLIEQNDGSIAFSLPGTSNFESRISDEQKQGNLFYNYLLLDIAAAWPMLRFENSLISLEILCATWHNKYNDLFDSCLQLLQNYWASLHYMLEDEYIVKMITCLVADLLDHWKKLTLQTRQSLCNFVKATLLKLHGSENLHLDVHALFKPVMSGALHAIGIERNSNTKQLLLNLVTYYCKMFGSAEIIDLILEHVQQSINDPHSKVQRASKDLVISLNPFMVPEVDKFDDYKTTSIQSIIMATPHTGSFRPVHYEIVMKHLGMSKHLLGDHSHPSNVANENSSEWARRLLHHCDTIKNMKNINAFAELNEEIDLGSIVDLINNSEPLLCYWAMWESARYCMLSRLRTPFGGPQQTFAAFERMLQNLLSDTDSKDCYDGNNLDLLRHLLLLLDRLELQISNATDGCATGSIPAVPRSSLIFFRTNKKTCHDYFLRIRPSIIAGAKLVRNDHLLITHVIQILTELESNAPSAEITSWFKEVNGYLCDLVEACIREKYVDLIYGMQAWYRKLIRRVQQDSNDFKDVWTFGGLIGPVKNSKDTTTTSNDVTWFQVAAQFASGRDEAAIKSLTILTSFVNQDEFGILDMLGRQVIHFYTCLENYDSLQKALDDGPNVIDDFLYESLRAFNASDQTSLERQNKTVKDVELFVANAPLESCLELSRLHTFRHWLTSSSFLKTSPNTTAITGITTRLAGRILQVFKDGIFSNISSLLELQLLQSDWENLAASARDWLCITSGNASNIYHLPPETKHWARLSTHFETLYTENNAFMNTEASQCLGFIQLHAAKIARRQGNVLLAENFINKAVHIPDTEYLALYERTKILFDRCEYAHAMQTANSVLGHVTSEPGHEDLKSKTYLKIARYLKNCPDSQVVELLDQLDSSLINTNATDLQSSAEVSIDDALEKSIENDTTDGRPWFEYATHYYKQGWRILDGCARTDIFMPAVSWASQKIQGILSQAGDMSFDRKQVEKAIFSLLLKYSSAVGNKELSEFDALNTDLGQLTPFLESNDQKIIKDTLDALQKMIISKFYASAQAYFRYLSLDIHNLYHVGSNASISSTSMVTTATLRLLRILTKYGKGLQSLFTEHIESVRVDLWKPVIPQLFAQLNHPNEFVRQTISSLINRICDAYPREIVYDVIVNSTSSKTNRETKQSLDTIASRMMDRNALLWVFTRRMVEELEKITVLLEERWLNKIASLQYDVMQQFTKLDQEADRLQKSDMLQGNQESSFLELYDALMKFVISSIDKFLLETVQDSAVSTPHEQWFQKTYGKQLIHACNILQKPTSMKNYRQGWEFFQQAKTHKVRILELSQVSPYLHSMKDTPIGLPGQNEDEATCFIYSFGNNVIVLPTKTKPKKLGLKGSDGKKYSYLFKGLEDLHLDERIMQLLRTTNGLLSENGATALRSMRARTYAVIPLSDHSGMIQWVNDATPFFALFKKWQKRESTAHMLLNNEKPNEAFMQSLMQRPTEQFTAKVATTLKAAGLRVTANRRYWPKEVLKKVYLELVRETPGDLLQKEIYYSSSSATEWLKKSTSFARSLAVTSIIGYIIGLGDRHLDNILLDFRSGEVIHIDYNVCFEKGKRLRVPELVPYRLTQNLYGALGITGVDGQFKAAAEETLRVLRKHKEVLITLLDAFVYDPLVDWESEAMETGHRQMMELQANLSLVATRVIKKQAEQDKERKIILGSLSGLKHNLHQWQESMLIEAETLNADDGSDEDEHGLDQDSMLTSRIEREDSMFMGRLPVYLLRELKSHLANVYSLVRESRSSVEGIVPLLESIIIIETDTDNELRPAQNSAKAALDAITVITAELKRFDKQLNENINYESEWIYSQVLDFIEIISKSVQDYFAALRTLEEFGSDSGKNNSSSNALEDEETNNMNEDDKTLHQQMSQGPSIVKPASNNHVTKIMKRIRSKLEGVDFGVQHKMSVSEQVARSIEQATSVDNLCMMYEGWTSWV
ncbi:hypothetical protein [Parasitella parasitica]|uniref:non-specific serine/threonine protein kinase n=1 Tax=Parasitella parasitica TaxID=35722 RepID=A0A0B7NGK4_9FUNG|nr:hypothetical protein [Parasitella parasitica]